MIAGRYRIVGLLGKGGMGEVYRADDLKLNQSVALKFLPPKVSNDKERLDRLHNEVRLARAVSHPNVCRVYDIGEVDGEHFLSMEYVDGEDLASLLRRIGRLPADKGIAIAQQLCAGLAAAHDRGVLHRDLKPANIMIDGRGHARITDFGLARLADEWNPRDSGAGTPAYMAPEQLAGGQVTVQSDLYALGLVLYELFTGKRPYSGVTRAERVRIQSVSPPLPPSSLVSDIDPTVERVILRCLERQPGQRPLSALAVAAALPGGDPLAAALAAGQTPAPEMVAAAGERGALDPWIGVACLVVIALGLVSAAYLSDRVTLISRDALPIKPEALEQKAREITSELGYPQAEESEADSAYGFAYNDAYLRYARERGLPVSAMRSHGIFFWYRRSPVTLSPQRIFETYPLDFGRGRVDMDDPPRTIPGMVEVSLDPRGHLLEFVAVPSRGVPTAPDSGPRAWARLFELAGTQVSNFSKAAPTAPLPVYVDQHEAWVHNASGRRDTQVTHADGGTYAGKVAYFRVAAPWDNPRYLRPYASIGRTVYLITYTAAILIAVGLAIHNLRLRRADTRGAARLGVFVSVCLILRWFAEAHHRADLMHERNQLGFAIAVSLYFAAALWFSYLAVEPYVRRFWPQTLISWSRLLAGGFRDPLVGRDLLIGATFAVGWLMLERLGEWTVMASVQTPRFTPPTLLGVGQMAGALLHVIRAAISWPLTTLTIFLVLRILLRRPWLAATAFCLVYATVIAAPEHAPFTFGWVVYGLIVASWVVLITRFGLLAFASATLVRFVLVDFPITADLGVWFVDATLFAFAVVLALAAYGFYVSLAGQKVFGILGDAR